MRQRNRQTKEQQMRGKNHKGSTLIFVICIMMVVTALSLSKRLGASFLLLARRRIFNKEQCRIMAESVSRQIYRELTDKLYDQAPWNHQENESLWSYAGAYVCEPEAAKRTFRLDNQENENWPREAGSITISLSCQDKSSGVWSGSWEDHFWETDIDLYVEIICTNHDSACKITDIYHKVNGEEEDSWKWSGLSERE